MRGLPCLHAWIQAEIGEDDSVLDLGCMVGDYTHALKCGSVMAVDAESAYFREYKDQRCTPIHGDIYEFASDSVKDQATYDHVLLIDVIEHIERERALRLLCLLGVLAKKTVMIFTPLGFEEQTPEQSAIGMERGGIKPVVSEYQRHVSGWQPEDFTSRGYEVDATVQSMGHSNIWAVKRKK